MTLNAEDQAWLEAFLRGQGGIAGSVHRREGPDLRLTAASNIPPPVLALVAFVPRGKGMAGQAQVRARPVQTCNLQIDDTSDINPMAKLVGGRAAIALPLKALDEEVGAVVGVAFGFEGEIGAERELILAAAADSLP